MKTAIWMTALGLLFTLLVSAPASPQPAQGQGGDQGPWRVPIASMPVDLLAGPLKLTDEEARTKVRELRTGGGQPDRPARQQVRQEYSAKVFAILTAEEKATIEKWRTANPVSRPGGNPPK